MEEKDIEPQTTEPRESESQDPTIKEESNPAPEENKAAEPFFNAKKKKRLLVCILATVIWLVFFRLSYSYFSVMIMAIIFVACIHVSALALAAMFRDWETIYKLSVTALYVAGIGLIAYYSLNKSGLLATIHSADDLVNYINNSGGIAEVIFVLANFLQVTIIPIPSTITTTAGAILFEGIWKPLYLAVIGLVAGSMFAFFLGRVLGVRFANWLVGEKLIAKYKAMMKGRDKIVLFYMFIFPFFPDDFLCILAGMTDYTYLGFFFLQLFSRTIGTLTTILIMKGIITIPLEGWWLALWAAIILVVVGLFILTIRYSDKIENFLMKIIDKITFGYLSRKKQKKEEENALKSGQTDSVKSEEPSNTAEGSDSDLPTDQGDRQ